MPLKSVPFCCRNISRLANKSFTQKQNLSKFNPSLKPKTVKAKGFPTRESALKGSDIMDFAAALLPHKPLDRESMAKGWDSASAALLPHIPRIACHCRIYCGIGTPIHTCSQIRAKGWSSRTGCHLKLIVLNQQAGQCRQGVGEVCGIRIIVKYSIVWISAVKFNKLFSKSKSHLVGPPFFSNAFCWDDSKQPLSHPSFKQFQA